MARNWCAHLGLGLVIGLRVRVSDGVKVGVGEMARDWRAHLGALGRREGRLAGVGHEASGGEAVRRAERMSQLGPGLG